MILKIVSFGYKHHHPESFPAEGRLLLDVRGQLSNPYRAPGLRGLDGTDEKVIAWIEADPRLRIYYPGMLHLLQTEQKKPGASIVYVGCTGGRHRSVYIANRLGKELGVPVEHWDLHKTTKTTKAPRPFGGEEGEQ